MCRAPLEGDRAAGLRAHRGDDAERLAEAGEHRPLLDMGFDEGIRKLLQPPAAHRSRLLGAEGDHGQRRLAEAVGGLDRRDDSERAVEAPPIGNRVEMRPAPDPSIAPTPEKIASLVLTDLETGLTHPSRRELVCRVLLGRVPGARAAADRVQLVEPFEDAHSDMIASHAGADRMPELVTASGATLKSRFRRSTSAGDSPTARTG